MKTYKLRDKGQINKRVLQNEEIMKYYYGINEQIMEK